MPTIMMGFQAGALFVHQNQNAAGRLEMFAYRHPELPQEFCFSALVGELSPDGRVQFVPGMVVTAHQFEPGYTPVGRIEAQALQTGRVSFNPVLVCETMPTTQPGQMPIPLCLCSVFVYPQGTFRQTPPSPAAT